MVRGNAALSLIRFGDASGRPYIVALLQPARIVAPSSGRVTDIDKVGTPIHQGGLVAKLQVDRSAVASHQDGQQTIEVRSPISGRIRTPPWPRERLWRLGARSLPWTPATNKSGKPSAPSI